MKIKKIKTFFPGDIHKEDDLEGKFFAGSNKSRYAIELMEIDDNYSLIGTFFSKKIPQLNITVKTSKKIGGKMFQNLRKNTIYVVKKDRLKPIQGEIRQEDIDYLNYFMKTRLSKNKLKLIELITSKKIYDLSKEEQLNYELFDQFTNKELKILYKNEYYFEKFRLIENKNQEFEKDIDFFLEKIDEITNQTKTSISKINVLNSKEFESNQSEIIKKMYLEQNEELERLKQDLKDKEMKIKMLSFEKLDLTEQLKMFENKILELNLKNDIVEEDKNEEFEKNNKNEFEF